MTGGVVYVWDRQAQLSHHINNGSVSFVPLDMVASSRHKACLEDMLEKFIRHTQSSHGKRAYEALQQSEEQFYIVYPKDSKIPLRPPQQEAS